MRIILLHNPKAGKAKPTPGQLKRSIVRRGHELIYASLKNNDWESILSLKADAVIIAGGDGSVDLTAWRLAQRRLPVYVLPVGTANNVARSLGHHSELKSVLEALENLTVRAFDLGTVTTCEGSNYFVESVGAGLVSELLESGSQIEKESLSPQRRMKSAMRRLLAICDSHPGVKCELEIDGKKERGRYLLVEIMNMKFIGPNLPLACHAVLDDGLLDVICVPTRDRDRLRRYLQSLLAGKTPRIELKSRRCRAAGLRCSIGELHVDDELIEAPSAMARLKRRAVRYLSLAG